MEKRNSSEKVYAIWNCIHNYISITFYLYLNKFKPTDFVPYYEKRFYFNSRWILHNNK